LSDQATLPAVRPPNLAQSFQELITAVVRLRCDRQAVSSAEVFRNQVQSAIRTAERNAKALGYAEEDVKSATFALVAFLDESILNLRKPVFNEWVRRPLQEEMFGRHVAGETFFRQLEEILGRRDAPAVADLLEVYYLCLLLGYLGRYSIASKGDLRALMGQAEDKIKRIRHSGVELSPQWALPNEGAGPAQVDPWMRRLGIGAAACAVLSVVLFVAYLISLGSGAAAIQSLASQIR
jgi:type VI secretion system protein ImpK